MTWKEVKSQNDMDELNEAYDNFEDSFITRMEYVSGDYVDSDLVGHMEQSNDLKVIFQRIDENPFSIELWFTNTKKICFEFVNPDNKSVSDILFAKVCKNEHSFFWTVWDEFDPCNEEHIAGTTLIESTGLKWRVIR